MIEALQNENVAIIVTLVVLVALAGTATFLTKSFINNCLFSSDPVLGSCKEFEVHP